LAILSRAPDAINAEDLNLIFVGANSSDRDNEVHVDGSVRGPVTSMLTDHDKLFTWSRLLRFGWISYFMHLGCTRAKELGARRECRSRYRSRHATAIQPGRRIRDRKLLFRMPLPKRRTRTCCGLLRGLVLVAGTFASEHATPPRTISSPPASWGLKAHLRRLLDRARSILGAGCL
jgi:hypothetical protein